MNILAFALIAGVVAYNVGSRLFGLDDNEKEQEEKLIRKYYGGEDDEHLFI